MIAAVVIGLTVPAMSAPGSAQESEPSEPSCSEPGHRQFDFWLGEWRVTGASGRFAGTNSITKILDGCALREEWTGASGLHGTSLNVYDASTGDWHQTWVDDNGQLLRLSGGLSEGSMVMIGRTVNAEGESTLHRVTWTPLEDGAVRQHWQASDDDGESWRTLFDGRYERSVATSDEENEAADGPGE